MTLRLIEEICILLGIAIIISCSSLKKTHNPCEELKAKFNFNALVYINLDTILTNGKSIELKFTDSSTFVRTHYDGELLFNGIKDALDCFHEYEIVVLNRNYSNLERPNYLVKMPVQALENSINLRYYSGNTVFQNIINQLLDNPDGKKIIDVFVGQYLGEIRYNDSERLYAEDTYDFMLRYGHNCKTNTHAQYLDTLNNLKYKIISDRLNSDVESTVIKFIDFCIGQCPS